MYNSAKELPAWDLADPKSMRVRFTSASFYVIIDSITSDAARSTAQRIKQSILADPEVRVRGPLALPTERRRHMVMREMKGQHGKPMYLSKPKRFRNVLLVIKPTSSSIANLIALPLPKSVNVKIELYQGQFELKDDLV